MESIGGDQWSTNLVSDGTWRYAAFYDEAGELTFGKQAVVGGAWTYHTVTGAARTALGLPVIEDEHNYPALGIDSTGKIHCAANMHNNVMRHIVSDTAGDITAWSQAPALTGIKTRNTYPVFVKRPDGTLRFCIRSGPTGSGSGRSDGMSWEESGGAWTQSIALMFQGLEVPEAGGTGVPGGDATVENETNWSPYVARPYVEDLGGGDWIEHWFVVWRNRSGTTGTVAGGSYIEANGWGAGLTVERTNILPSYLRYVSVTDTWEAVDGTAVTFPITPLNNPAIKTDLTPPSAGWINLFGYTVDDDGHPHVLINDNPRHHLWWNGTIWQQETLSNINNLGTLVTEPIPVWLRGRLWGVATTAPGGQRTPFLIRTDGVARVAMGGIGSLVLAFKANHDPEALRLRGTVEVMTPTYTEANVVTFGNHTRMSAT